MKIKEKRITNKKEEENVHTNLIGIHWIIELFRSLYFIMMNQKKKMFTRITHHPLSFTHCTLNCRERGKRKKSQL